IAQDPATAGFPDMPAAAAALGPARLVLPPEQIGPALQQLVTAAGPNGARPPAPAPGEPAAWAARTTVLLVDDHRIVLDGLRLLLDGEPDMAVVAEAEDGLSAVRLAAELSPDVVVMDLSMPGMDGFAATEQILARSPATRVVALTAQADLGSAARALAAGATTVLSKQRAFDDLVATIRQATADGSRPPASRGGD
ncbi:MAG: DNA-binding response regulator, partial [Phycisphaerales bacterium]|nr:DNA-binding response regulator [Phycisphaerales bacterium]